MRKTNPACRKKMTLPFYASLSHVKVAGTIGTNVIDDALKVRGFQRHIVFKVPSWRDARHIVSKTDLVAAIPARWARDRDSPLSCAAASFPLDDVTFSIDLEWHTRVALDPGHAWLRGLIARQFEAPANVPGGRSSRSEPTADSDSTDVTPARLSASMFAR